MMPAPLVTAIIPIYNRAWCIRRSVESVLAQTYRPLELIVVDDGSTDETPAILKEILESGTAQVRDIAFSVIRQENRGVSAARNAAIRQARGELIALLDSDDVWKPTKTTRQVEHLLSHPEFPLSQTDEEWIRRGVRVNCGVRHQKIEGDLFERSLGMCAVSPSAVMMRRDLFGAVGLFDESYPACEDYEMWLRVTCRYAVGLLREPLLVKYGGHSDQLSATVEALDGYRIRAIAKMLESGGLDPRQTAAAIAVLETKCRIYAQGCRKRGREDEAREAMALAERYRSGE